MFSNHHHFVDHSHEDSADLDDFTIYGFKTDRLKVHDDFEPI